MEVTGTEAGWGAFLLAALGGLVTLVRMAVRSRIRRADRKDEAELGREQLAAQARAARAEKAMAAKELHEERRTRAAEDAAAAQIETAKELVRIGKAVEQFALELRDVRTDVCDVSEQIAELRDDIRDWTPVRGIPETGSIRKLHESDDTPVATPRAAARVATTAYSRRGSGGKED
jgi:hypothetical protein